MQEVVRRQAEWANKIADAIDSIKIAEAVSLMTILLKRLEHNLPKEVE